MFSAAGDTAQVLLSLIGSWRAPSTGQDSDKDPPPVWQCL